MHARSWLAPPSLLRTTVQPPEPSKSTPLSN